MRTLMGAVSLAASLGVAFGVCADEVDAKKMLKAMSDYMAGQTAIAFDYDTSLEVVTKEQQKVVMLTSSGKVTLNRPDKIRATRDGGFSNVEMIFDGTTLTMVNRNANQYAQAEVPGTIDHLTDELRDTYHKPVPGADLLSSNVYDALMPAVIDTKDLGSGVIGGQVCNHFAFRNQDVDWQIWVADGDRPYPCRYVVTSKQVDQAPQYTVDIRNWTTGTPGDFRFANLTNAKKIDPKADLGDVDELPRWMKGTNE